MLKKSHARINPLTCNRGFPASLAVCFWIFLVLLCGHPALATGQFQLAGDWWKQPAVKTRHTCFMATFDSVTSNDADYARGDNRSGGDGMNADVDGKYGQATCLDALGGHLHFRAQNNFEPDHGTIRMLVKGDVWNKNRQCWLFEARGYDRIGIVCETNKLSLVIHGKYRRQLGRIDLPLDKIATEEWHWVVASWDRSSGKGWIALDGRGVSGPLKFPAVQKPMLLFYIGGGYEARRKGTNEPGLCYDEVEIYDVSLEKLQTEPKPLSMADEALLPKAEAGARKYMNFIADLQCWGGWQNRYTWPTMISASAGRRQFVKPYLSVWTEEQTTPTIAAQFCYAYNILGDYRFLQVVRQSGELFAEVQNPDGYWCPGYIMTLKGMIPDGYPVNFQEVQRAPNFLLAYLYRLTGEKSYLEAVKRSGEFHLKGQNPNGSFSHHWNPQAQRGETYKGQPYGGELNDSCTNDIIDTMILCYHMTSDRRYIDALKRVGQWLVDAQLDGPMYGWADCYDKDNNPAWAREFEPPAYGGRATRKACRALVEIYRLSGDEKYLKPVRRCLDWLKKDYPDGMYFYHDHKTGRPISSWQYKIVYLDEPEGMKWIRSQPVGGHYYSRVNIIPALEDILANARRPTDLIPKFIREKVSRSLPQLRQAAARALAEQNKPGLWIRDRGKPERVYGIGPSFSTSSTRVLDLLRYIEAVRMVNGELPLEWRGCGDKIGLLAWPKEDWYDVGW